jgi:hypothetical protein
MAAAESTKHQRFDHGFGDLAGGGPIHHEVGAGSAPDVGGGDEDSTVENGFSATGL